MSNALYCSWCKNEMAYIHGHAACISSGCAMFGLNQAECCSGESAEFCSELSKMKLHYPRKDYNKLIGNTYGN